MEHEITTDLLRPLQRSDRPVLHAMLEATRVFTADEIAIALELIDAVLETPDHKDYRIAVYDAGDGPKGYYCIGPTPGTDGTYDLYWIVVAPEEHGRGIGLALTAHAEATIRQRQGRLVIAETSSTPRYDKTRMFYKRRGYAELARIPGYYRSGDDLVVYGKYLVPQQGV